ncbi:DUF1549 domain-containing protein [Tundrisphaera sp. TA3]|uniref:DUF1549 domain-containing protein n=1 Tax=Tundrisphaera sp. TA3 TaxID=3435775 RepID=UPI003EBBE789
MGVRDGFLIGMALAGLVAVGVELVGLPPAVRPGPAPDRPGIASAVDAAIRRGWAEAGVTPTQPAPDLVVMRRLALALTGSIPSLEEIRRFEARPAAARVDAYLDDLLHDRRTADYLAERFARAFVGTEGGPFLVFRRRRFVAWLADAILEDRPYDATVRAMIADRGLWTDHPATNFVSVTYDQEAKLPDPERLAARVSRAFLGTRIDCAQCHDHPFQPWKQADFRGLAAFFGEARSDLRGIGDGPMLYRPADRKTLEPTQVAPRVPSHPELCPDTGKGRQRLAAWVTHPDNPALPRATANRAWALLFGRPLVEPIDDLPPDGALPPALTLLADDFSGHGFRLHRLIRAIVATEAFRLDGAAGADSDGPTEAEESAWAAFPLTRLRPEQVAGALDQAGKLSTLGPRTSWVFRLIGQLERNDFVKMHGDTGEDEFNDRVGTIPQRLLLMNGKLANEAIQGDPFRAPGRIAALAPDDRTAVEVAYLTVLTRRPDPDEAAHFAARLAGTSGDERKRRLTDLCWTLVNSTEFSWNH